MGSRLRQLPVPLQFAIGCDGMPRTLVAAKGALPVPNFKGPKWSTSIVDSEATLRKLCPDSELVRSVDVFGRRQVFCGGEGDSVAAFSPVGAGRTAVSALLDSKALPFPLPHSYFTFFDVLRGRYCHGLRQAATAAFPAQFRDHDGLQCWIDVRDAKEIFGIDVTLPMTDPKGSLRTVEDVGFAAIADTVTMWNGNTRRDERLAWIVPVERLGLRPKEFRDGIEVYAAKEQHRRHEYVPLSPDGSSFSPAMAASLREAASLTGSKSPFWEVTKDAPSEDQVESAVVVMPVVHRQMPLTLVNVPPPTSNKTPYVKIPPMMKAHSKTIACAAMTMCTSTPITMPSVGAWTTVNRKRYPWIPSYTEYSLIPFSLMKHQSALAARRASISVSETATDNPEMTSPDALVVTKRYVRVPSTVWEEPHTSGPFHLLDGTPIVDPVAVSELFCTAVQDAEATESTIGSRAWDTLDGFEGNGFLKMASATDDGQLLLPHDYSTGVPVGRGVSQMPLYNAAQLMMEEGPSLADMEAKVSTTDETQGAVEKVSPPLQLPVPMVPTSPRGKAYRTTTAAALTTANRTNPYWILASMCRSVRLRYFFSKVVRAGPESIEYVNAADTAYPHLFHPATCRQPPQSLLGRPWGPWQALVLHHAASVMGFEQPSLVGNAVVWDPTQSIWDTERRYRERGLRLRDGCGPPTMIAFGAGAGEPQMRLYHASQIVGGVAAARQAMHHPLALQRASRTASAEEAMLRSLHLGAVSKAYATWVSSGSKFGGVARGGMRQRVERHASQMAGLACGDSKTLNGGESSTCSKCGAVIWGPLAHWHVLSGCRTRLVNRAYTQRHNRVLTVIARHLERYLPKQAVIWWDTDAGKQHETAKEFPQLAKLLHAVRSSLLPRRPDTIMVAILPGTESSATPRVVIRIVELTVSFDARGAAARAHASKMEKYNDVESLAENAALQLIETSPELSGTMVLESAKLLCVEVGARGSIPSSLLDLTEVLLLSGHLSRAEADDQVQQLAVAAGSSAIHASLRILYGSEYTAF